MAGVTGDFAGLDKAIREVLGFATGARTRKAVGAISSELSAIVRESFERQTTPEGKPWKPLKRGRNQPLVRSGRLRAVALRPILVGLSVRFGLTTYGGFQNDGTSTIPARAFLPEVPLSSAIEARLRAVALRAMK